MFPRDIYLTMTILSMFIGASYQCPEGCICENRIAQCTGIDSLPVESKFPDDTEEYEFRDCTFNTLPKIAYPKATKVLVISSKVSDIVDEAFSSLTVLEHLVMLDNPLSTIRPNMFNGLHNLTKLILTNLELESFPGSILSNLPKLITLDLSGNSGITFDNDAFESATISRLNLNRCSLNEAPVPTMGNPETVSHLEMSGNNMDTLGDGSFLQYMNLEKLYLENSGIRSVHKNAFETLSKLEELYIGVNRISWLPVEVLEDNTRINKIDLRQNNLTTLSHKVVEGLDDLKSIDVSGNPWNCNCSVSWFANYDLASADVMCAEPAQHSNSSVINATSGLECECMGDDCDGGSSNWIGLAIGIPIIILCVCLIGYFAFRIIRMRSASKSEKNVRYSAVYRDTTEAANKQRPSSEL